LNEQIEYRGKIFADLLQEKSINKKVLTIHQVEVYLQWCF